MRGPSECWPWKGGTTDGYGLFCLATDKNLLAHRVAYELYYEVEPTLNVLHKCDFPLCCNPKHLYQGTQADNVMDCVQKNRCSAKLTPDQVVEIRNSFRRNGRWSNARDLALNYGIAESTLYRMLHGESWKHLPGKLLTRTE